ncbi:MAG: response regulator [Bacteroidota bacterium]
MTGSVLIVNTSKEEKELMESVLSTLHLNFSYCEHGREALVAAKRTKPLLVISHIPHNVMDGITMADIMQKDRILRNTPIIFVHDELDLSLIAAAKQVNSKAFLIKPYINSSLVYAVRKVLESVEYDTLGMSNTKTKSYTYA